MIEKIVCGIFSVNTYVISNGNEAVVVDPGQGLEAHITAIKDKYKVKAILITHGHIDHIDGIKLFDCPVYITKRDEEALYDASLSLYDRFHAKTPYKQGDLNIININDGDELDLIGYKFKVIATPGHTAGGVCYLYNNKLLSGDTLFRCSIGRTDFPTGDITKLRDSLKKLMQLPNDVKVYPGHDEQTTIRYEKEYNPFCK